MIGETGPVRSSPFVLVHGSFHGGWCWKPLAASLRLAGHDVFSPTQTGLGERRHLMSAEITIETFILDVLNLLVTEDLWDVVLVGHSFGGRAVCGVADRIPERIKRVVFIDAGLPENGRSRLETMPAEASAARIAASMAFDGGISVPPPPATRFDITDPEQIAWVERGLTPQPLGAEKTAITLQNPLGNSLPVTYIHCIQPAFAVTESSAAHARAQAGWRFIEFPGGHSAIITHPDVMAQVLLEESRLID